MYTWDHIDQKSIDALASVRCKGAKGRLRGGGCGGGEGKGSGAGGGGWEGKGSGVGGGEG